MQLLSQPVLAHAVDSEVVEARSCRLALGLGQRHV